ncbi:uncharacterized protein SCHCODRAFT_02225482 [Schizophyllum commune H4-8]|uniref:uncharacterized protein n=1 Tax=Schizophyllum commune (strain H4-8 / FGSC 9210) TaxID=578458 RepID=UPI00215E6EC3|nr:uncharacterized protein SCHCODRAFT_02225482 [Schizophyllum commune H4-8]KAI5895217.1 hypothetical protein SCHCODRAFT_02225482 [Schizophyllum commune H4-8]
MPSTAVFHVFILKYNVTRKFALLSNLTKRLSQLLRGLASRFQQLPQQWETGSGRIDGLQFQSETRKVSLRWGKCGGKSTGEIAADDRVKSVCFVLGMSRGPYHARDPVPLGVRALVEES